MLFPRDTELPKAMAELLRADAEMMRRLSGGEIYTGELPRSAGAAEKWARLMVRVQPSIFPKERSVTGLLPVAVEIRAQVGAGPSGGDYDVDLRLSGLLERAAEVVHGKRADVQMHLPSSLLVLALDVMHVPGATAYRDDTRAYERAITVSAVLRRA